MTAELNERVVAYTGNGATVNFTVDFPFLNAADLEVIEQNLATLAETLKVLGTDYTVSGGGGATGTVTATTAPPATVRWVIRGATPLTQATDWQETGGLSLEGLERSLDKLTFALQEQARDAGLRFRLQRSSTLTTGVEFLTPAGTDPVMPVVDPVTGAGTWITTGDVGILAAQVTAIQTAAANIAAIVTTAAMSGNVGVVAGLAAEIAALGPKAAQIAVLALLTTAIDALGARTTELDALGARTAEIDALYAEIGAIAAKANIDVSNVDPEDISGSLTGSAAAKAALAAALTPLLTTFAPKANPSFTGSTLLTAPSNSTTDYPAEVQNASASGKASWGAYGRSNKKGPAQNLPLTETVGGTYTVNAGDDIALNSVDKTTVNAGGDLELIFGSALKINGRRSAYIGAACAINGSGVIQGTAANFTAVGHPGTGQYTGTMTVAAPNTEYMVFVLADRNSATARPLVMARGTGDTKTTTQFSFTMFCDASGVAEDVLRAYVVVVFVE